MMPRYVPTTFLAVLTAVPALLLAQDTSAKEDERMAALSRNDGQWYTPKTRISVGFRMLSSGGQVDFKNLGSVPSGFPIIPASSGADNRGYNDGAVYLDSLRADEKDSDGNQTSTPGGTYRIYQTVKVDVKDADGNVTGTEDVQRLMGEYLSYTPGVTRGWEIYTQAQLLEKPGYVAYHQYSTLSEGAGATKKQGASGGVELNYNREFGRGSRHLKWGVLAGVTLNDINSKTAGTITSSLRTYTDYFSTNGVSVPLYQLSNPSSDSSADLDGDQYLDVRETTVPLNPVPDGTLTTDVTTPGGASVTGRWQVKGAYFMIKFGPTLRTQLTDRLGLTASIGFAGAYAGTRYSANEVFTAPALPDVEIETHDSETGDTTISSTKSEFLTGYYADLNLEWDANETFGLFGGVTAQQLDAYEQKLGDRAARIDLGSAVGVRGGVTLRF